MIIQLKGKRRTSETITHEFKNFRGGSNLLLDEARIADNEAALATNLISVQDGLWQPRWGTDYYVRHYLPILMELRSLLNLTERQNLL